MLKKENKINIGVIDSKINSLRELQNIIDNRTLIENKAIDLISVGKIKEAIELLKTIE